METIWSVVCFVFGRRIRGMACISSTVPNSFMPMTVVFSRSSAFSSATRRCDSLVIASAMPLLPERLHPA
jgi:hypothetical protein